MTPKYGLTQQLPPHRLLLLWGQVLGGGPSAPFLGRYLCKSPWGGATACHRVVTGASHMFKGTGLGGNALSSAHTLIPFLPQFPEEAGSPGVSRDSPGPWGVSKGSGEGVGEKAASQATTVAGASTVAPRGSRTEQGKSPREEPGGLPGLGRMKARGSWAFSRLRRGRVC